MRAHAALEQTLTQRFMAPKYSPSPVFHGFRCFHFGLAGMSIKFPSIHDLNVSAALRNYHLNPRLGTCRPNVAASAVALP